MLTAAPILAFVGTKSFHLASQQALLVPAIVQASSLCTLVVTHQALEPHSLGLNLQVITDQLVALGP